MNFGVLAIGANYAILLAATVGATGTVTVKQSIYCLQHSNFIEKIASNESILLLALELLLKEEEN